MGGFQAVVGGALLFLLIMGCFYTFTGHQDSRYRGVRSLCSYAVVIYGTALTDEQLFEQILNHWDKDMLSRLDRIVRVMGPMDQIHLFGAQEWQSVYEKHQLNREQRAVLDEFLEDCSNICA